jgi:hypothetical protein
MPEQEHGQVVGTEVEARGAERGPMMRNLLAWSLGLIVAAFAVVDFFISKPDQFNGILLVRSVSRPWS